MGIDEEIKEIEEEIAETPYNKATEQHIGRLKAKLSKLKEKRAQQESGSGGGGGYAVEKTGDATVVLVGFPSVGKSTLLNQLTNAESETGDYGFTTIEVVPGMLKHRGAEIQILDVPGLIEGASGGRGKGREVLSVVRSADLLLFLVDVFEPQQYTKLRDELYSNGIRMDTTPPEVIINRRDRGSIDVRKVGDVSLSDEAIKETCNQHGIVNASVVIREDITLDELNDAILDNRVYVDTMVAVNKVDLADEDTINWTREELSEQGVDEAIGISAEKGLGLDVLKERMFESLDLIRVYLKPQGGEADMDDPLVVPAGSTVKDVARKIHRDFQQRFRYAKVWGESAKHDEQQVGKDHELA
ncbi:MAG: GTP-binding protein, partial [Halobacteria archaeon]|nr:GTP-binding protein [Halobacteria archaeon]